MSPAGIELKHGASECGMAGVEHVLIHNGGNTQEPSTFLGSKDAQMSGYCSLESGYSNSPYSVFSPSGEGVCVEGGGALT